MVRTRVGYAGGTRERPSYANLGDHSEAVQVDYDPTVVTFERLLEVFWAGHEPTRRSSPRRYRALLFVHDAEQARLAEASLAEVEDRLDGEVRTEIRELQRFWTGERKHQKYNLRRVTRLRVEYDEIFETPEALRDSTAAARVNGYAAGFGTPSAFEAVADRLGLSEAALRWLRRRVEDGHAEREEAASEGP